MYIEIMCFPILRGAVMRGGSGNGPELHCFKSLQSSDCLRCAMFFAGTSKFRITDDLANAIFVLGSHMSIISI